MNETFTLEDEHIITDLETLKVISDPFRIQILEFFSRKRGTVKQLADHLDVPPKKLYYHVNLLEEHGLIVVAETQIVSGIIEKWYQGRAKSYTVERSILMQAEDGEQHLGATIAAIFESTRSEIIQAARHGLLSQDPDQPKHETMALQRSSLYLTPAERTRFAEELKALMEGFCMEPDKAPPEAQEYGLLFALYPRVSSRAEETEEDKE